MLSFSGWMRLSRERVCTASRPVSDLVDVHRVEQRLVEPGLELLGHDEDLVLVPAELLGGLATRGTRSSGSRCRSARVVDDLAREGDQRRQVGVASSWRCSSSMACL